MNRSKKLSILLGILAVACTAVFAVNQMEERKEQIRETGEIILELSEASVQSLSWEYNGERLSFHREDAWIYDEDEHFPVSEEKINQLLEPFQPLGAAFLIEDVEDFGQYGLDKPVCTIRLSTADQDYEIKLGDYSKMDSQRYVSIGDGNVYLVKHDPLEEYDAGLSDMIAHDEIPSFDQVSKIQFAGAETYSITYQENSADTYSADDVYFAQLDGQTLPLDTGNVERYLRSITNLNPVHYVSYNATEEELQAFGLDTPELTITVDYTPQGEETGESFILYVSPDPEAREAAGDEEEISAYVRVGQSQILYKISPGSYEKLAAASCDDLRHAELIWADFSHVQRIDAVLDGESYTFTSKKSGRERVWLYQEEEFEITGIQRTLEALSAREFTSEPPAQKEEISLTVYLDNENFPRIQIKLYRYDGNSCLAVVDGRSISLVDRTDAVDLIEAIHAVVLD